MCDTISIYKDNIHKLMVKTFESLNFWKQFDIDFLRVFKKYVDNILKNNMIHFLGSDVHRPETIYAKMPEIMQELRKILDRGQLNKLTRTNAELVLENKTINIEIPQKIKKSFWN